MKYSALYGGLLGLGLLLLAILLGTNLEVFFDFWSVLIFLGLVLGFLLQANGPRGVAGLFRTTRHWLQDHRAPRESVLEGHGLVDSARQGTRLAAVMGPFIGGIQILRNADLDNLAGLGPALGVMLLIPFYAATLQLLYWGPLQCWLEQQTRS
ncbi:MAG: hypothetical protein VX265_15595 [Myxococcota bacterium]|nr:hypothetical protein [Myxococcota bacterium]